MTALLQPGEEILWHGRPRPVAFILREWPSMAYGVTWAVLGAFWYRGAMMAQWNGWWKLVPYLSLPFIITGFRFWFRPIESANRARRLHYVVTTRRIFIAELASDRAPELRVFTAEELASPQVIRRFDGLDDVILTRRAQELTHLVPGLRDGFFGLTDGARAAEAVNAAQNP